MVKGLNGITPSRLSHTDLAAILFKLDVLTDEIRAIHQTKQAAQITREASKQSPLQRRITFYDSIGETELANSLRTQIAPGGNGKGNGKGNGAPGTRVVQPIAASINVPTKP